jgi:predicted amidohydrolase YtcJ
MSVTRLLLSLLLLFPVAAPAVTVPPADYVFKHGSVYTVDNDLPWAEAVAVSGGRIVYVGREPGVGAYVGKQTRVIDMGGGMLLPGFIDSHAHIGTSESRRRRW